MAGLVLRARHAEQLGFESVWITDHIAIPPDDAAGSGAGGKGGSDGAGQARLCQDLAKFRQSVGNLIKNAFQHRRQRLEIDMDCVEDRLLVEVVDDGSGVEKENRELIFMRYTRMKPCTMLSRTGHGLGLAGARILARRMGGDIIVKCERGQGTVFRLTLPLVFEHSEELSEQGI